MQKVPADHSYFRPLASGENEGRFTNEAAFDSSP
jgi:hypothetical protein